MEPEPKPEVHPKVPKGPVILVAVVAVVLAAAVANRTSADDPAGDHGEGEFRGTELAEGLPRPDIVLTDTEGRRFDLRAETSGRLTLLFFGYTSCPDVCPLHLANLADAIARPGVPEPVVVFVGVDRERDTPEAIRTFLDRFDESFVGLTGTEEELVAAQEAAQVPVAIIEEPAEPGGDYLVGHATQILAITADDVARVAYPFGVRQQDWIDDLPKLARVGDEGR